MDADMLVLQNIDELFWLSSGHAGGSAPEISTRQEVARRIAQERRELSSECRSCETAPQSGDLCEMTSSGSASSNIGRV